LIFSRCNIKENILFIAGGKWQKPFVKYLKDKGHHVSIVNPIVTETTKLGDVHVVADVNDSIAINCHISHIKPGIVTSDQSDISTAIVARISEELGLNGNTISVIRKFTEKYEMYKFALECEVPVPDTQVVTDISDVLNMGSIKGYPVIIKPNDATMSRGFLKLDTEDDVSDDAIEYSRKFSKTKTVIVQKFVEGNMITLEGICSGGKHRTVAVSMKDGFFVPGINCGVRYPCKNVSEALLNKIIEANDHYVEHSKMKYGLTHSEYILGGDMGFSLIETGARGGGAGIIDKIVPWVSGVNPYDVLYESLVGCHVDVKALKLEKRHALLKYYRKEDVGDCNEELAEIARKLPGVADFQYDFIGQQYVKDTSDIRHSMGIYLGENEEDVERVAYSVERIFNPKEVL
jgi:biotin carboxylase